MIRNRSSIGNASLFNKTKWKKNERTDMDRIQEIIDSYPDPCVMIILVYGQKLKPLYITFSRGHYILHDHVGFTKVYKSFCVINFFTFTSITFVWICSVIQTVLWYTATISIRDLLFYKKGVEPIFTQLGNSKCWVLCITQRVCTKYLISTALKEKL